MKRVLLTVALCVAASASFAQKKVVNEAQSIAKGSNADFGEARTLIKGALENPETKDDAKTWYVAGFIEDQQFNAERAKQILGQQPNEPVLYEALYGILPYFQNDYDAAKRDFTVRSGLVPKDALFEPEQLAQIYHALSFVREQDETLSFGRDQELAELMEQVGGLLPPNVLRQRDALEQSGMTMK